MLDPPGVAHDPHDGRLVTRASLVADGCPLRRMTTSRFVIARDRWPDSFDVRNEATAFILDWLVVEEP